MKPVLKFNIRNQKISRVDNFLPVRYSRNYLYAEFDFKTEDWTLVAKTAIFTSQNHTIHVVLGATDTCLVPPEVLTDTWFTVSVFGGNLITVTTEKIKLYESGYRPDGVPEPTPDVYTQLLNMVSSKADGLSYSENILSLLSGDKTIATVTITSASNEGDSTAREIELRNNGTYIQWKYTDETLWRDLVSLEEISGKDAYKYAQEAGYTKSEEQFAIDLAKEPGATEEQAKQIEKNKKDISSLSSTIENYAKKTEIPAKTSQLQNDSGFLTQHQDLSDYAKKTDIPSVPTKLSQLEEDTTHRVVTDEEKENWNNKSNFSGSYNDLTDQPTIPTMPTVPSKVSQLENDSNYQTDEQVQETVNTALEELELPSGGNNVTYGEEIILINETVEIPIETPVTKFEYDLPEIAKELNHFHVYIYMGVATNEHIAKETRLWLFSRQMIYWNMGNTTPSAVWNTNIFIDFTRKLVDFIPPNSLAQDVNRFPLHRYCRYSQLSEIDRNINKFVFELLSEYSGTVTIRVYGYK